MKHRDYCPSDEGTIVSERHGLELNQITDLDLAVKTTTTEDAVKVSKLTDEDSQDYSSCETDVFKLPLCDLLGDVNIENWESITDEEIKQIESEYLEDC